MVLLKKIAGVVARSLAAFAAISVLIIIIAFLPSAVDLIPENDGETPVAANVDQSAEYNFNQRNGSWHIHPDSAVYAILRTPREKVNVRFSGVTGSSEVADLKAGKMTATVKVDVNSLDSGLKARDNKMLEADFLDGANHPSAVFQLKGIGRWPQRWKEGESQKFSASGTLSLKGVTKDVNFECEGMFVGDRFLMKGTHTFNMNEYGINAPDGILIRTEKDATINLQLVLIQEGKEGSAN